MVVCGKREVYSDFTLYTQYLILQTSLLFFVVESQEFLPCNSVICILWSRSISKLAGANWVSPMYFPIYDNITKPLNSSAVVASCYIHDGICCHMLWFITEKMTFKNITGKLITWTQLHDFLFTKLSGIFKNGIQGILKTDWAGTAYLPEHLSSRPVLTCFHGVHVVKLHVFAFLVRCCKVHYDVHVKM